MFEKFFAQSGICYVPENHYNERIRKHLVIFVSLTYYIFFPSILSSYQPLYETFCLWHNFTQSDSLTIISAEESSFLQQVYNMLLVIIDWWKFFIPRQLDVCLFSYKHSSCPTLGLGIQSERNESSLLENTARIELGVCWHVEPNWTGGSAI